MYCGNDAHPCTREDSSHLILHIPLRMEANNENPPVIIYCNCLVIPTFILVIPSAFESEMDNMQTT